MKALDKRKIDADDCANKKQSEENKILFIKRFCLFLRFRRNRRIINRRNIICAVSGSSALLGLILIILRLKAVWLCLIRRLNRLSRRLNRLCRFRRRLIGILLFVIIKIIHNINPFCIRVYRPAGNQVCRKSLQALKILLPLPYLFSKLTNLPE